MRCTANGKLLLVLALIIALSLQVGLILYSIDREKSYSNRNISSYLHRMVQDLNSTLLVLTRDIADVRSDRYVKRPVLFIRKKNVEKKILTSARNATSKYLETRKRVVIFTMDSMLSYESNSQRGGAAGEINVRKSLEDAFSHMKWPVKVCRSDEEFHIVDARAYDIIILDPWTWAAPGWVPKPFLIGHEKKIYILDFFGAQALRGNRLQIPPTHILTAFGSPWNSFLGYYMKLSPSNTGEINLQQGVIWGKDPKYFQKAHTRKLVTIAATVAPLVATSDEAFTAMNVRWIGHQSKNQWVNLLSHSKFLLGLGDPLLGPSAIDAISLGLVYINPIYESPVRERFFSQHPYASDKIGKPYVCSYHENYHQELIDCINYALSVNLPRKVPFDFEWENYLARVKALFD